MERQRSEVKQTQVDGVGEGREREIKRGSGVWGRELTEDELPDTICLNPNNALLKYMV